MPNVLEMPIGRRTLVGGLAVLAAGPARADTRKRYVFDQKSGTLEFTAHHLGVLSSTGRFDNFMAELLIDPASPLTSHVSATVQTAAIDIAYPGAADLLRSADFFDVAQYPVARFNGAATGQGQLENFTLAGDLTIRNITKPFRMEARLLDRQRDPQTGADIASFFASGDMKRSEYGMVSDTASISDTIRLSVRVRIIL